MLQKQGWPSNRRLRSFLTPYSKYGSRSLSTSESHPQLQVTPSGQGRKSYIDFRRVRRQKQQSTLALNCSLNPKVKLKLDDLNLNRRESKMGNKLHKCTMNRLKENRGDQKQPGQRNGQREREDNNYDLVKMVRQLKQRNLYLEEEDSRLKQKEQEDMAQINKLNEIVRNLEQAIYLTRSHASHSLATYPKDSKYLSLHSSPPPMTASKGKAKCTSMDINWTAESRLVQLRQQNSQVYEKYMQIVEENMNLKEQLSCLSRMQENECTLASHQDRGREEGPRLGCLDIILQEYHERKLKQLEQIDCLLYTRYP